MPTIASKTTPAIRFSGLRLLTLPPKNGQPVQYRIQVLDSDHFGIAPGEVTLNDTHLGTSSLLEYFCLALRDVTNPEIPPRIRGAVVSMMKGDVGEARLLLMSVLDHRMDMRTANVRRRFGSSGVTAAEYFDHHRPQFMNLLRTGNIHANILPSRRGNRDSISEFQFVAPLQPAREHGPLSDTRANPALALLAKIENPAPKLKDWLERGGKGHADFSDKDLSNVDLHGLNLRGANLRNTVLSGANLSGCDLRHANLQSAVLDGVNLENANLSDANLSLAHLWEACLSRAILEGANLENADLGEADLQRANLAWAKMGNARCVNGNFHRANLDSANLSQADLSEASLNEARLVRANLSRAKLIGAKLFRAAAPYADFSHVKLTDGYLVGANLLGANFKNADLTRAQLRGANLCDANIVGATRDGTDFLGAWYDDHTQFTLLPWGFDPAQHNMIHWSKRGR